MKSLISTHLELQGIRILACQLRVRYASVLVAGFAGVIEVVPAIYYDLQFFSTTNLMMNYTLTRRLRAVALR